MKTETLIKKLEAINVTLNGGHGANTVQWLINDIRRGDIHSAMWTAYNDHDKFSQYPEVETLLDDAGYCESYQTFSHRFQRKHKIAKRFMNNPVYNRELREA